MKDWSVDGERTIETTDPRYDKTKPQLISFQTIRWQPVDPATIRLRDRIIRRAPRAPEIEVFWHIVNTMRDEGHPLEDVFYVLRRVQPIKGAIYGEGLITIDDGPAHPGIMIERPYRWWWIARLVNG